MRQCFISVRHGKSTSYDLSSAQQQTEQPIVRIHTQISKKNILPLFFISRTSLRGAAMHVARSSLI